MIRGKRQSWIVVRVRFHTRKLVIRRVPKAFAKAFGAGVLTFHIWNVQPSNGVVLDDAMMLNIAVDESPYPQPTPQEKKRLKEIAFEEQKKNV